MNARLAILDEELKAINDATKEEDRDLQEQQFQEEKAAIQKRLAYARYASERESIQKELNDLIAKRERELQAQERQDRVAAINEEKAELQDRYNAKINHEQDIIKDLDLSLQDQITATQKHYDSLLQEEKIQAEARRLILDENNQEMVALLEDYNPYWQDAGQSFGESLLYGLNSTKQSIQDTIDEMLSSVGHYNTIIANAKRDWESAFAAGDNEGMDIAHQIAEQARNLGGTLGADETLDEFIQNMRILESKFAYETAAQNIEVIRAKQAWERANERDDAAGMREAQLRAEAAREAGATIGDVPLREAEGQLDKNKEIMAEMADLAKEARELGGSLGNIPLDSALDQLIVDAKLLWERGNETGNDLVKQMASQWADELRKLGGTLGNIPLADALKHIGKNAMGTNYWKGGLSWVGERGPELIDLPRGSKVYSNQKSMEMIDSDLTVVPLNLEIPLELDGREVARATVNFTAEELSRLITRKQRGGRY